MIWAPEGSVESVCSRLMQAVASMSRSLLHCCHCAHLHTLPYTTDIIKEKNFQRQLHIHIFFSRNSQQFMENLKWYSQCKQPKFPSYYHVYYSPSPSHSCHVLCPTIQANIIWTMMSNRNNLVSIFWPWIIIRHGIDTSMTATLISYNCDVLTWWGSSGECKRSDHSEAEGPSIAVWAGKRSIHIVV